MEVKSTNARGNANAGSCGDCCEPLVASFEFNQGAAIEVRTAFQLIPAGCKPTRACVTITNSSPSTSLVATITYIATKYGTTPTTTTVSVPPAGTGPSVMTFDICRLVRIDVASSVISPAVTGVANYTISTLLSSDFCGSVAPSVAGSLNVAPRLAIAPSAKKRSRRNWKISMRN